jgi:serine/threonine protein kinase
MPPPPRRSILNLCLARACLALASLAWATKIAGLVNHQERLVRTPGAAGVGAAGVLDRITSWSFLHDAAFFARWRADLDVGGLRKLWAAAALEVWALVGGAISTTPAAPAGSALVSAALLACLAVADPPEMAVEIVYNHRSLGARLPSYRLAVVAGCVVGSAASFAAALAIAWGVDYDGLAPPDPPPPPVAKGAGDPEAPPLPAKEQQPSSSQQPSLSQQPSSSMLLPPPLSAAARDLSPLAFRLEALNLGFYNAHRARAVPVAWAWCGACCAITGVGVSLGAASGGWWPTHVPLGFLVAGVQALTLCLGALNSRAGPAWARGKAGTATLVCLQAAIVASMTRINRSWASTATLFGFRLVGSTAVPPGFAAFSAGAWLFLAGGITLLTFAGTRVARPTEMATAPPATFQRDSILAGLFIACAGFWVCVGTTAATAVSSTARRAGADRIFYPLDADALWLLYLAPVPMAALLTPGNQCTGLAYACCRPLAAIASVGFVVAYAYLWNPAMALGNRLGLGAIIAGFGLVISLGMVEPGGPVMRAGGAVAGWVRRQKAGRGGGAAGEVCAPLFDASTSARPGYQVTLLLAPAAAGGEAAGQGVPPSQAPLLILDSLLGVGSFASVYRATFGGAPVAAKCVFAANPATAAAARREAALGLSLKHPNVLATYAVADAPVSAVAWPPGLPLPPGALAAAGAGLDTEEGEGVDEDAAPPPSAARLISIVTELADGGTLERAAVLTRRLHVGGGGGGKKQGRRRAGRIPGPLLSIPAAGTTAAAGASTPAPPPHAPTVLATLHDVAAGLAYLHSVGIVHGDLKSANVLLRSCATRDGAGRAFTAVLADFGLSKSLNNTDLVAGGRNERLSHYTNAGHGTMCYAAPELLTLGRLGPPSDVYALGVLMHEVWTGRPPFGPVPPASIFYAVAVEGRRPEPDPVGAPPGYLELMRSLWSADLRTRPSAAVAAKVLKAMADAASAADVATAAVVAATTPAAGAATSDRESTASASSASAVTVASWLTAVRLASAGQESSGRGSGGSSGGVTVPSPDQRPS